jgi:hypothetical protein
MIGGLDGVNGALEHAEGLGNGLPAVAGGLNEPLLGADGLTALRVANGGLAG